MRLSQLISEAACLTGFCLLMPCATVLSAEDAPDPARTGTVAARVLNVRAKPGVNYEVVAKLEDGQRVEIVSERPGWFEIRVPRDAEAWCAARFIDDKDHISEREVRVRSGPGVVFSAYATLTEGQQVQPVGDAVNGWQRIRPPAEATAWVSSEFVNAEPLAGPEAAVAEKEEAIAEAASAEEAAVEEDVQLLPPVREDETGPVEPEQVPAEAADEQDAAGVDGDQAEEQLIATTIAVEQVPAAGAAEEDAEPAETGGQASAVEADPDDGMLPPVVVDDESAGDIAVSADKTGDLGVQYVMPGEEAETDEPADAVDVFEQGPGAEQLAPVESSEELPLRRGIVIPLGQKSTAFATHFLAELRGERTVPRAYLRSSAVKLDDWRYREVRVHGDRVNYPGWSRPVIVVHGIQLENP